MSYQHVLWVNFFILCYLFWGIKKYIGAYQSSKNQGFQRLEKGSQRSMFMRIIGVESSEMVGEKSRKEPIGEVEKWKQRAKVWEKLENGGIANYIAKLHGFDLVVTNSMVNSWKDGRVKVNGV